MIRPALCVFAAVATASSAAAQMPLKHHMHMTYHRNVAWPEPFAEADAMQTLAPFEQMKRNGWRAHNMIGTPLFTDGGIELSPSGHQRVGWIATQAPPHRRQIFVAAAATPEATDQRIAAINQAVERMNIDGPLPPVYITHNQTTTSSGAWVTKINRDRFENSPPPVLPAANSGDSGLAP